MLAVVLVALVASSSAAAASSETNSGPIIVTASDAASLSDTTLDSTGSYVAVTAGGAVSVTDNSLLEAAQTVTLSSGGSGSTIADSQITGDTGVSVSSTDDGTIDDSTISSSSGPVVIEDSGEKGDSYTITGSQIQAGGDALGDVEAVEVQVTGGCAGALTSVTAIEAIQIGADMTLSFPADASTGCADAVFSYAAHGTTTVAAVAGGTGGTNSVAAGTQQGGVSAASASGPSVTLTFSGQLPLAVISSPASGGTYSLDQSVPTSFACLGSCADSNGQGGPANGSLQTSSAGPQTYSVTATEDGDTFTASDGYTVLRATPGFSWSQPAAITYGTPLSSAQLDATTPVDGSFAYSPPAGTILHAGQQNLSVLFTPTDQADYTTASDDVTLQVNPAPLTVTASSASVPYGAALPAIQPAYSPFVNGDSPADLSPMPTCGTPATAGSPVGSYPTTCSGESDPNYDITNVPGTLQVTQAATALAAAPVSVLGSLASGSVTFRATLTSKVTGNPISGAPVTFTWGGIGQCTTPTNATGVASCRTSVLNLLGFLVSPVYTAHFAGSTDYSASSNSSTVTLGS